MNENNVHRRVGRREPQDFSWDIGDFFNIGVEVCDRWADVVPNAPAIIEYDGQWVKETSFDALRIVTNRLANMLTGLGLRPGDRVGILAPQRLETAAAHIAVYKSGAIAVPLFTLFGQDALEHRLKDSGARFLIADTEGARKLDMIQKELPDLEQVILIDAAGEARGLLAEIECFEGCLRPCED